MATCATRSDCKPTKVLQRYWEHWARRDKAAALALLADDAIFALYVPQEVLPFGGETQGKPSLSDRLQMILDQFDTVRYSGTVTRDEGHVVLGNVEFTFRHKLTGEAIDGTMRVVVRFKNGLITRWDEYHDVEKVRAFMRLIAYVASE